MPRHSDGRLPVDRTPDRKPAVHKGRDFHKTGTSFGASVITDEMREKARHNLAVIALDQPGPEEWLADVIGALGLQRTPAQPGRCRECGGNLAINPQKPDARARRNRGLCDPCGREANVA